MATHYDATFIPTTTIRLGRRPVLTGLAGSALALVAGQATPVAGRRRRKLKPTFRCPGPADGVQGQGSGVSDRARQAQVFTAGRSGALRRIAVGMAEAKDLGDYVLQLVAVIGSPNGVPSTDPADVLAEATIKDNHVPVGPKTIVAHFTGPQLVAGTEYAIVVTRLGNTELTTQVRFSQDNDGIACPNSRMFSAIGDAAFQPVVTRDMVVSVAVA